MTIRGGILYINVPLVGQCTYSKSPGTQSKSSDELYSRGLDEELASSLADETRKVKMTSIKKGTADGLLGVACTTATKAKVFTIQSKFKDKLYSKE